jgi:hypothetical protein
VPERELKNDSLHPISLVSAAPGRGPDALGVAVTIRTITNGSEDVVGNVYELQPEGLTFKKPVALRLRAPATADGRRL